MEKGTDLDYLMTGESIALPLVVGLIKRGAEGTVSVRIMGTYVESVVVWSRVPFHGVLASGVSGMDPLADMSTCEHEAERGRAVA